MPLQNFVILILCTSATLEDLIEARQHHNALPVDILHYDAQTDYFRYRADRFRDIPNDINLMFVFGQRDAVIVSNAAEEAQVRKRLEGGDC